MTDPREAALTWVRTALSQELPEAAPVDILDLTWQFHAIADHHGVPIEELVAWLHDGRGKAGEFSPHAFREHAKHFAELQRAYGEAPQK